jgi:hypothetical protein
MIHHSDKDYDVALGEATAGFKAKLEEMIHKTQRSAMTVIERVQRETPVDRVADSTSLEFSVNGEEGKQNILMGLRNRKAKNYFNEALHKHALDQVCERAGIPGTFVNRLLEKPYGRELIVENLTTIFKKDENKKFLVRSVNDEVRGVLSNSFKRMDSGPIIEAFAKACEKVGAVPVEGVGGELRWAVKAILPMVFQPKVKNGMEEVLAFGIQLSNSDYGKGVLGLNAFCTRLVCTNTATLEQVMRQVHLGKRLSEDIEFAADTYKADTNTQVLAIRDMVGQILAADKINALVGRIGEALEKRIDPKEAWQELPKMGLLKGEIDQVKALFIDGDVEVLPRGTTQARLSNAVSWFAKSAATPERRLELEEIAGELLLPKLKEKAAA